MAEISLHFQAVPGWAGDWVSALGVRWVKAIDPPDRPFCNTRVVGRTFMPDADSNALIWRGKEGALAWFNRWLPVYERCRYVYAFEGPNEPQPMGSALFRKALAAFTAEWNELMHRRGWRTVVYNLSVGWPDVGTAADLKPGLAAADYLGLHEYSAPQMQSGQGWYCLRYRRTVEELGGVCPPILITECGIDGGVAGRPQTGWRTFATEDEYLSQLTWYRDEMAADGLVQSAFVFTSEPVYPPWYDFGVSEALAMRFPRPVPSQPVVPPLPPVPVAAIMRLPFHGEYAVTSDYAAHRARKPPSTAPGIDYALPAGTPVLSAAAGQVSGVRWSQRGGLSVWVNHGDGLRSYYAHLSSVMVGVSQVVRRGQIIARSGNTGMGTGPHLHFSVQKGGAWVDPAGMM